MASIYQRTNKDGSKVWRVVVRVKGHPTVCEHHERKKVAVLTIIIHRLHEVVNGKLNDDISVTALKAAFKGLDYYQTHALRCYASVSGGSVIDAEIILNLIKQKRIPNRFKAQDIYHQGLGGYLIRQKYEQR